MRTPLVLLILAAVPPRTAASQAIASRSDHPPHLRLLDVPYVSQIDALCGGAAIAMVFRYWGLRDIHAADFALLVDEGEEGIRGGLLVEAVIGRGWRALPFQGTAASVRSHLSNGRPLVALVEDRPGRYHYVVIVGWGAGRVLLHDPAHAPFRALKEAEFENVWRKTGHWTLLILPPQDNPASHVGNEALPTQDDKAAKDCGPFIAEAVRLSRAGDLTAAANLLTVSSEACPASPAPFRELAGVRFLQSRWAEAAHLAEQALSLDPRDAHAWQLLAAGRFLDGDLDRALRAWNHLGEPRVDVTRIDGLTRTRYAVVVEQLGLAPRVLLTEDRLRRARRQLAQLPVQLASRVDYRPVSGGLADVHVAVLERSLVFGGPVDVAASAVRAATEREVAVRVASPTGSGELWTASWRWWENRPRVSISLAVPGRGRLPGVWHVEGTWEEQSYRGGGPLSNAVDGSPVIRERRRRGTVTLSDWRSGDLRWELTTGLDRWEHRGLHLSLGGAIDRRLAGDRLAVHVNASDWRAVSGGVSFRAGALSTSWRSSTNSESALWLASATVQAASKNAPLDLWPRAGVGHVSGLLLRAHPLLDSGIVRGKGFGRVLAHGSLEFHDWIASLGPTRLGLAAFVDCARPWRTPFGAPGAALQADAGAGLRLDLSGWKGVVRIDGAWGLRDGHFAISTGWQPSWPR